MMRRFVLNWLARQLKVPVYFEVLPLVENDFKELDFSISGIPSVYSMESLGKAVWPKPDRHYRIFVQPE